MSRKGTKMAKATTTLPGKLDKRLVAMLRKGARPVPKRAAQDDVGPTPEMLAKAGVTAGEHRISSGETWRGARCVNARPIDRYRRDGAVSEAQHRAGTRLRSDWIDGSGSGRTTALYGERQSPGGDISDSQAERHHDYVLAMQALGPELSPVIVHVVLLEGSASSWAEQRGRRGTGAKVEGMVTLRIALDRLARHYRLTGRGAPE